VVWPAHYAHASGRLAARPGGDSRRTWRGPTPATGLNELAHSGIMFVDFGGRATGPPRQRQSSWGRIGGEAGERQM
jgi:hypothetical protein